MGTNAVKPQIFWQGRRAAVTEFRTADDRRHPRNVATYFCWRRRPEIGFAFKLNPFVKHVLSG
jgi:hypothetical protein